MHQLNILPAALHYYKQALELGPSIPRQEKREEEKEGQGEEGDTNIFDLRMEIAYNISVIYRNSDNYDLARYYIDEYIVVWLCALSPTLLGCDSIIFLGS